MFYSNNNDGYPSEFNNFIDNLGYITEERGTFNTRSFDSNLDEKLNNILKFYEMHEIYVENLVNDFKNINANSIGLENQILELFNNVRSILIKGDKRLMENCIRSILVGKENALRFIEDQGQCMDDNTLKIMNAIISEYSHHINYLNEAISVL